MQAEHSLIDKALDPRAGLVRIYLSNCASNGVWGIGRLPQLFRAERLTPVALPLPDRREMA